MWAVHTAHLAAKSDTASLLKKSFSLTIDRSTAFVSRKLARSDCYTQVSRIYHTYSSYVARKKKTTKKTTKHFCLGSLI